MGVVNSAEVTWPEQATPIGHRRQVRRGSFFRDIGAWLLVSPLLAFMAVAFVYPIGVMLFSAVDNSQMSSLLTKTSVALRDWQEGELPNAAYAGLADDLIAAEAKGKLIDLATELNYKVPGFRSLAIKTHRAVVAGGTADRPGFRAADPRWMEVKYWVALKRASSTLTPDFMLAALDLEMRDDGSIGPVDASRRVYVTYLLRTLTVSLSVAALTLAVGYLMAFAIAQAESRVSRILMLLVLLPFWTSLLVRTAAWVVILQRQGMLNETMMWLGVINEPIQLVFNRVGVLIGMTHVLLPFAVLPIHSSMKNISPTQLRAATSLGARPLRAFVSVYLPQTKPGIAAAGLIVFVLANGFYITPALLGGAGDQLISSLIADLALNQANWGMASALAIVLFAVIALMFVAVGPLVRLKDFRK